MTESENQWVLLFHSLGNESHYDLMIRDGSRLLTWRLVQMPTRGATVSAERIADHRLLYLDYEGPLSGNRGEVKRIDRGRHQRIVWSDEEIVVDLEGQVLQGRITLRKQRSVTSAPGLPDEGTSRWSLMYEAPGLSAAPGASG